MKIKFMAISSEKKTKAIVILRKFKFTYPEIGELLGMTKSNAHIMFNRHEDKYPLSINKKEAYQVIEG